MSHVLSLQIVRAHKMGVRCVLHQQRVQEGVPVNHHLHLRVVQLVQKMLSVRVQKMGVPGVIPPEQMQANVSNQLHVTVHVQQKQIVKEFEMGVPNVSQMIRVLVVHVKHHLHVAYHAPKIHNVLVQKMVVAFVMQANAAHSVQICVSVMVWILR
jgi:hypothetical protein